MQSEITWLPARGTQPWLNSVITSTSGANRTPETPPLVTLPVIPPATPLATWGWGPRDEVNPPTRKRAVSSATFSISSMIRGWAGSPWTRPRIGSFAVIQARSSADS